MDVTENGVGDVGGAEVAGGEALAEEVGGEGDGDIRDEVDAGAGRQGAGRVAGTADDNPVGELEETAAAVPAGELLEAVGAEDGKEVGTGVGAGEGFEGVDGVVGRVVGTGGVEGGGVPAGGFGFVRTE